MKSEDDFVLTPTVREEASPKGRPKGTGLWDKRKRRELALSQGVLPHEWLLHIMHGNPVLQCKFNKDLAMWEEVRVYPSLRIRIDCAKHAAPYFAPKLISKDITHSETDMRDILRDLGNKLPV